MLTVILDTPADEILGHGWFREFFVINKYAISSAVALIEVFIYSSIRRQTVSLPRPLPQAYANCTQPIYAHVTGISSLAMMYIGWAYAGHEITDRYAYFFLDHKKNGWDYTAGAIATFVALSNICKSPLHFSWALLTIVTVFGFNYAVTAFRELLTQKSEQKSYGYTSLPQ